MSTNSLIGGLIGGVAGFFIGGPAGAAAGAGIGMGLGAALTPIPGMSQQGPRLSDLKVQTSTYGVAIPRVYGTVGITGNVIWLEGNQIKEVVKRSKVKSGGKGGSKKTTITTYTYYATLAIGLCEGPIAGVRRIWAGPNLIYDSASDDLETIIASNQNAAGFSVYLGSADQQPDSRIQADRGVANTPAYRGLAYVVIKDFLLTDYGNAIPALKVEMVKSAAFDGFRQMVNSSSGVNYESIDRPYLYAAGSICRVSAGSDAFVHRLDGKALPEGQASVDDVLPYSGSPTQFPIGKFAGEFITANISDATYVNGVDIYRADGSGAIALPLTAGEVTGKKLAGITCSLHGDWLAVVFISNAGSISTAASGTVHLFDSSLALVRTLSVASISVFDGLCVGRSALKHYGASCISSDGNRLFLAYGAGDRNVSVYDISGAAMVEVDRIDFAIALGGTFIHPSIGEVDGIVHCCAGSGYFAFVASERIEPGVVPLAEIVSDECALTGLDPLSDIDVSGIDDEVIGYRVAASNSVRSIISQLRAAFPMDVCQIGYQVRFIARGGASVATIGWEFLGVDQQLQQSREMDCQLPAKVSVSYLDNARNYDASQQFAERINTDAVNDEEAELPIVIGASKAAQVAERLIGLAWLERSSFGPFDLPPTYRHLEPADVITVDAGYAQYEIRLTEVSYNADGSLTCSGVASNAAVYVSAASSDETPSEQTIALAGESLLVPLDIPVIDETIQNAPSFVAAVVGYSIGWPGAIAVQSIDDGQTWREVQAFDGQTTLGYARGSLAHNSGVLIDHSTLVVDLVHGDLDGVSESQMLAGTNWAAYGADGRWEIVRFQNATLQGDGSYAVSGFKRGDKGTEWATGLHQSGDLFVALDDGDLALISMAVGSIGAASIWRGVTAGDDLDSASDVPFTYQGVNLECLSPVYPASSRNGSGDLSLAWTRRSRLSSSWWATGTVAPLGEESESYEVDILSGATVVRTISSSTPSITYTAAQQTADFGSPQASIATKIYQLSAVVGRGAPLEVTA